MLRMLRTPTAVAALGFLLGYVGLHLLWHAVLDARAGLDGAARAGYDQARRELLGELPGVVDVERLDDNAAAAADAES